MGGWVKLQLDGEAITSLAEWHFAANSAPDAPAKHGMQARLQHIMASIAVQLWVMQARKNAAEKGDLPHPPTWQQRHRIGQHYSIKRSQLLLLLSWLRLCCCRPPLAAAPQLPLAAAAATTAAAPHSLERLDCHAARHLCAVMSLQLCRHVLRNGIVAGHSHIQGQPCHRATKAGAAAAAATRLLRPRFERPACVRRCSSMHCAEHDVKASSPTKSRELGPAKALRKLDAATCNNTTIQLLAINRTAPAISPCRPRHSATTPAACHSASCALKSAPMAVIC